MIGNAIAHIAGVGVSAVLGTAIGNLPSIRRLAPGPSTSCRSGGEGMKEAHVSGGQRCPHVRFGRVRAQVDAQFERASCFERNILWTSGSYRRLAAVKSPADYVHLLFASESDEIDRVT